MSNKLLLLLLRLGIGIAAAAVVVAVAGEARAQRLRLPSGYNMRLTALPPRLVGKGAYTLATKRSSLGAKSGTQQRLQLTQWTASSGKKDKTATKRSRQV